MSDLLKKIDKAEFLDLPKNEIASNEIQYKCFGDDTCFCDDEGSSSASVKAAYNCFGDDTCFCDDEALNRKYQKQNSEKPVYEIK